MKAEIKKEFREWRLRSQHQLPRFNSQALVKSPLTYCWVGLLIAFATLYFHLAAVGRPIYEFWFNSDYLSPAGVYRDIFSDGFPFSGFRFSIASCLFPDVIVTALLMKILGGKVLVAAFSYGLFQFTLLTGSFALCGVVAKVADRQFVVSSVLLVAIGLVLITALSAGGFTGMLAWCFITSSQVSCLAMAMLAASIAIGIVFTVGPRVKIVVLLFVVCFLTAGSSLLFVNYFVLPWLVTVSVLCYLDIIPFYRVKLTSFFACSGSACGVIAERLLVNAAPIGTEAALDLKRMTDALLVYVRGSLEQYRALDPLHLVAAIWIVFCLGYVLTAIRRRIRMAEVHDEMRGRLLLFLFMLVSGVGSAVSIIVTGINGLSEFKDYKYSMHYQYPLFLGALFGIGYMLAVFLQSAIEQEKIKVWQLRICAAVAVLVPAATLTASPKQGEPLYRFEPPLVRFLDSKAAEYGLTYGVGGFWQTRGVNLFSRAGLRAYPVTASLDPFYWVANKYWYLGYPKSRYPEPKYNFIILDDPLFKIAKEPVVQRFGEPAAELKFEQTRILVYNRISDLAFNNLFRCDMSWALVLHPLDRAGDHFHLSGICLPGLVGTAEQFGRIAKAGVTPPGYLSYGPYLRLPPGEYTLELQYQVKKSEGPSIGTWDAGFFDGKSVVLGSGQVLAADHEIRKRITVSGENAQRGLELRVLYEGRADVVVQGFDVIRENP